VFAIEILSSFSGIVYACKGDGGRDEDDEVVGGCTFGRILMLIPFIVTSFKLHPKLIGVTSDGGHEDISDISFRFHIIFTTLAFSHL